MLLKLLEKLIHLNSKIKIFRDSCKTSENALTHIHSSWFMVWFNRMYPTRGRDNGTAAEIVYIL